VRRRNLACVGIAGTLLLVGCTSGGSTASNGTASTTSPTTAAPSASGPAPGVTANSIKIGVTYVDTKALLKSGLNYNLGDWQGAWEALINQVNAAGGINGRKLVPDIVAIDPTDPKYAQAACVKFTEDDKDFLVAGFFVADAVNCVVDTHKTPVVGGTQTTQRVAGARASWLTPLPGDGQTNRVIQALKANGSLSGKVGVFVGQAEDSATLSGDLVPALKAVGVTPVQTAVMDAPVSDTAAIQTKVNLIAQKFDASGIGTVVLGGLAAQNWPAYMEGNPYHPKLLFIDITGAQAFTTNKATTNTSLLAGSIAGGPYGPNQQIFEESQMQACIKTLAAAGVKTPAPDTLGSDMSDQPFQAAFNVCPVFDVLKAWLQAAGKNLNDGTLQSAINGLNVHVSGDPTPRVYSPAALDGSPKAYLFSWDPTQKAYVLGGK
jgi:ABC-type branched-subunit amino acid transport system substrate-binding protein